jgi:hypothetical protein
MTFKNLKFGEEKTYFLALQHTDAEEKSYLLKN